MKEGRTPHMPKLAPKFNYWNVERVEQEAASFIADHGSISKELMRRQRRLDLNGAIRNHFPGGLRKLKEKLDLADRKPPGYWTAEKIEEAASELVASGSKITYDHIREKGHPGLADAITKYYPRGIAGLRKSIGLPKIRVQRAFWTVSQIEKQAADFHEKYGSLSTHLMKKEGKSDLVQAIWKIYPGGIKALQEKYGSPQRITKPGGYWTLEKIEEDAQEFLQTFGEFGSRLLQSYGRHDLYMAIHMHYPGRFVALKEKLGIMPENKSTPLSSDEANMWLKELVGEE